MRLYEASFVKAVDDAIRAIEDRSGAEVVLAIAPRSASYRAQAQLAGWLAAVVLLGFMLYSHLEFSEHVALGLVVLLPVVVTALADLVPGLLSILASRDAKAEAVRRAARAAFVDEAMTGTRDRSGVLVYYSHLEDRIVVLPDAGVLARVGDAPFVAVEDRFPSHRGGVPERLIKALGELAEPLSKVPRRADDTDELPNAPRFLDTPSI